MAPGRRKQEVATSGTRAAESGARIQHSRQQIRERQADRGERARQFDESTEQRNLDRWDRQWQQRRADRAARDKDRAERQADKPRTTMFGTEGRDPNAPPSIEQQTLDERRRQFDEGQAQQQQQFETSTDLRAASQGLQRAGGGPETGARDMERVGQALEQNPNDPRLQQMMQEMQRGRQQMGMGVEQTGRKGFVPTEQSAQLAEREMRAKETNAAANYQRAVTAHAKAAADVRSAKTAGARKEAEAKQKLVEQNLEQPIKSDAARMDRFMKGEQTDADVQTMHAMLKDLPPVGNARALHDAVNAGNFNDPAVTRFLGEKVAASAIQFIYATGKLPDGKLVDFSSAGMQEFSRRALEARQLLLPNTVAGQLLTDEQVSKVKRGYNDHLEMVNKLAALLVMKQQPAGPSGALSPQQEPTHEQRRADPTQPITPAERAGQITPEEAARRAGQSFDRGDLPTKKPYREPYSGGMGTRGGLSGNLPYGV